MNREQVSALPLHAFRDELQDALRGLELGKIDVPEAALLKLQAFCALMLKWNASLNLSGARTVGDLLQEHLPDAFVLAHVAGTVRTLVDVGTGGGLPAIPLAILRPDVQIQLVEPRAKRVAFLRTAVRELNLPLVNVWCGRVEDLPVSTDLPDAAMSRATFSPDEWVPIGAKAIKPHGRVFALLNDRWEKASLGGVSCVGTYHYALPRGQQRTVAWF